MVRTEQGKSLPKRQADLTAGNSYELDEDMDYPRGVRPDQLQEILRVFLERKRMSLRTTQRKMAEMCGVTEETYSATVKVKAPSEPEVMSDVPVPEGKTGRKEKKRKRYINFEWIAELSVNGETGIVELFSELNGLCSDFLLKKPRVRKRPVTDQEMVRRALAPLIKEIIEWKKSRDMEDSASLRKRPLRADESDQDRPSRRSS